MPFMEIRVLDPVKLKRVRIAANLSFRALANKTNGKINHASIKHWEENRCRPNSPEKLQTLTEALGVDFEEISSNFNSLS